MCVYGGKLAVKVGTDQFLNWLDSVERVMLKAETDAGFYAPGPFKELVKKPKGVISLGAKMGEGWLLTAEMIELVQGGYGNIVCAQPFGCLPNHIVGKGMVNKIRALYPSANITPIDYDPSATRVNQENRIKLMLAVAKERLNDPRRSPAAYGRAARRRRPSGWRYRVTKANTIKQGSRCTAFLRSSSLFAGKEPLWKSPQLPVIICPACSSFTSCTAAFCRCTGSTGNIFDDWCTIGSIYGAPAGCIWGGGRISCGGATAREVLALLWEYGISGRLTFSNSLLRAEHLADPQCNALCERFAKSGSVPNGVIVHSDLLADYLQQRWPELYLVSSTTKVLTEFAELRQELEKPQFRYVVPDFRLNPALEQLRTLPPEQKRPR